MVEFKPLAAGSLVGTAVIGIHYVEGLESLQLLVVLGLVWAIAGWTLARNYRTLRDADTLPTVLFVLLVVGVPPFGVHADLLLGELRTPLMYLTTGVAIAGIGVGMEMSESESINEERTTAAMSAD